jgi:signal transduction histidine kinase
MRGIVAVSEPTPSIGALDTGFAEETTSLLRSRCIAANGLFLFFAALSVVIEASGHPERRTSVFLFYAAEIVTCLIAVALLRIARTPRSVVITCASLSCSLALYLVAYSVGVGLEHDVLAMALLSWITIAGILLPWGGLVQTLVFACAAIGFELSLLTPTEGSNPIYARLALLAAGTASIVGAASLQRHRRTAFEHSARLASASRAEQEKTAALALLLEIHHVLARDDGSRRVLDDIARIAKDALECDFVAVYVLDTKRDAYALMATSGQRPEVVVELERMEWSRHSTLLGKEIRPGHQVEIADATRQSLVPPAMLQRFEIASALYVPVTRSGALGGFLLAGCRKRTGPFGPRVRELSQAIADALGVALENRQLIEDLKVASRIKSEFVATMSHELRTPLNAILGYADLLADGAFGPLTSDQDETLRRILRSGKQLYELVAATLDLGRLEAGREVVSIGRVGLPGLVQSVAGDVEGMRRPGGPEVRWTNRVQAETIYGDAAKIRTILRNLVANAIKFTPAGAVDVVIDHEDGVLLLEVRDTGIGIPAEDLELIFGMFRQGNSSNTRTFEGVGLGLFITKSLLALLGGSIEVSSAPGVGSTFRVRIPADHAIAEAAPEQPVP